MQVVAVGLALALLCCCGGVAAFAPVDQDLRPFLLVASLIGWVVASMVGVMAFAVINRQRIARRVDAAFAPLGLQGESQMTIGRQYHGTVAGRRLDGYFQKGPSVELIVQAHSGTRVAVAPGGAFVRAVQGAFGKERFDAGWPELGDASVSAEEAAWARDLLADPEARQAVAELLGGGQAALRVVSVQPGAVALVVRGSSLAIVDGDRIPSAVAALGRLAARVEAQPPPQRWMEPSPMQERLRARRPGPRLAVGVAVGTVLFVGILSGVVILVVLLTQG